MARSAKTLTANGDAQIDTAQSKFGGASGLFDGAGDYVTGALGSDAFGTGDFTIDFWVRHNSAFVNYETWWSQRDGGTGFNIGTDVNAGFTFYSQTEGVVFTVSSLFSLNTWHHVAVTRSGTTLRGFVDGVKIAEVTNSTNYNQSNFGIGDHPSPTEPLNGWIDEFRVSKGIARWTADFTPESSAYDCSVNNDTYTVLMAHMDGADASTTFTDDNSECVTFIPQVIII